MNRLKPHDAALLRQRIERGEVQLTLETYILLNGSCRRFQPKPASAPTTAKPGSSEKIAVLRARIERGEHLWHPSDNQTPLPPVCNRVGPYQPAIRELTLVAEVA